MSIPQFLPLICLIYSILPLSDNLIIISGIHIFTSNNVFINVTNDISTSKKNYS